MYPAYAHANADTIVVSRSQIEKMGARTLLDIFQLIPQVSVSFGVGGESLVGLLGVRGDSRILQLINGKPINQSYAGQAFWRMPADVIERVEISLGGWQPWFGPGGLQGAIDVFLREREGVDAQERLAFIDTMNATVSMGKQLSWGQGYLSTSVWDESLMAKEIQPIGFLGKPSSVYAKRQNGQRLLWGVVGSLEGHTPEHEVNTRADAYLLLDQTELGTYWNRSIVSGGVIGVDVPVASKHLLQFDVVVNANSTFDQKQLSLDEQSPFLQKMSSKALEVAIESQVWLELVKGNTLHLDLIGAVEGVLPNGYYALSQDRFATPQSFIDMASLSSGKEQNCFLLGRTQKGFGACRVWSTLTALDDWVFDRYVKAAGGAQLLVAGLAPGNQFITILPQLKLDIIPDWDWQVGMMYADTARLPTFVELFDQSARLLTDLLPGRFLGNSQLTAEKARNLSVSLGYRHRFDNLLFDAEGRAFFTRIRQVAERVEDKADVNILRNDGGYDVVGLGIQTQIEFAPHNQVFFSAQWLRSYWRSLDPSGWPKCRAFFFDAVGDAPACSMVTNIPQLQLNLGGNFSIAKAGTIYVLGHFVSERRNNVRTDLERTRAFRIPAYGVLNASYMSPIWLRYWRIQVSFFNILNTKIQNDVIFPDRTAGLLTSEGFSAYAGIAFLLS